jgi:hypothetical protein
MTLDDCVRGARVRFDRDAPLDHERSDGLVLVLAGARGYIIDICEARALVVIYAPRRICCWVEPDALEIVP